MKGKWKWLLAGLVILGFLSSGTIRTYWQRKVALRKLQAKLADLKHENKELSQELQRLKTDPRVIEQVARRDLGLIQPGEIEYRFVVQKSDKK